MTVRVRFAPSPTGYLHIGGARTALYNYLYAKANNGKIILRIEDTDLERSSREFEDVLVDNFKWLGIEFDEGPENPGEYGPYRQSERGAIYRKYAEDLVEKGHAFHCFCTDEELEAKKEIAVKENRAPIYDGTCKKLSKAEVKARLSQGDVGVIRFTAPPKTYSFKDHVRGDVSFPEGMVGDFVILRSNKQPVYNFCCAVDDWLMKISHVIRAEEHLANTLRQLMLYEAFGVKPPEFAHVSLLVNKDRQKLSKRDGATSVGLYRDESYIPEAMLNYLCLLGWSHPEEKDIFDCKDIGKLFTIDRFIKSPALFDFEKFKWVNGQHLKKMSADQLLCEASKHIPLDHIFHQETLEWRKAALDLSKEYIQFFKEIPLFIDQIFATKLEETPALKEILSWETTPKIKEYLRSEVSTLIEGGKTYPTLENVNVWGEHIKNNLKIKGKQLFQGMRGVLTGKDHGPDLKLLIPLTPLKVIKDRLE